MDKQKILGESLLLTQALEQLSIVAPLNKPVLIVGERGTGKELVAERLHYLSSRWDKPYLTVNCAALSESLLESTLFGHDAGAFTGASKSSMGLFERADQGTLFLDELGTVSTRVQEKLLRVIEYGEFERLGGQKSIQTDIRLISATNADLVQLTNQGLFRADLLDRLAFDVINLPPLRLRNEDILILAEHFAIAMCIELGREVFMGFSQSATHTLQTHTWPGNIRELKNAVQRSVYRQQDAQIALQHIILDPFKAPWLDDNSTTNPINSVLISEKPIDGNYVSESSDLKKRISDFEIKEIRAALIQQFYHQRNTAQTLGLTYHQLRAYLKKYPQLLNKDIKH
jgi:psp operon transcriptional activator